MRTSTTAEETARHRSGDDDFGRFVSHASLRLRRALVARYGVELGSEATADAIAYAWEHRGELDGMGNPVGYLFRVGQTSVRRNLRLRRPLVLPPEITAAGHVAEPVDVTRRDVTLPDALAALTDDQRVAVALVHAHAYSYAEAAEVMDVPVTTLRNLVHRGMTRLRQLLEHPDD